MVKALPRRIVFQSRFAPKIAYLTKMDAIGEQVQAEFPDWQRALGRLEMTNRHLHRRMVIAHDSLVVELNGTTDHDADMQFVAQMYGIVTQTFEIKQDTRFGIRTWYALVFQSDFDALVASMFRKLFADNDHVRQMLGAEVKDVQYPIDLRTDGDGWDCHFRVGPMRDKEWVQRIQYADSIFEPPDQANAHSLELFLKTIPPVFMFVDIDLYRAGIDTSLATECFNRALTQVRSKVRGITSYFA